MSKIKLSVPYAQKDEAKSKGARWDPTNRYWYVNDNVDLPKFQKWLPAEVAAFLKKHGKMWKK